jgi:hypothetical protein
MIATYPKCGGKRIEMWLCLREAGCTARPRCESLYEQAPQAGSGAGGGTFQASIRA